MKISFIVEYNPNPRNDDKKVRLMSRGDDIGHLYGQGDCIQTALDDLTTVQAARVLELEDELGHARKVRDELAQINAMDLISEALPK